MKRTLCVFLSFVLVFVSLCYVQAENNANETKHYVLFGDMNADYTINASDALVVLQQSVNKISLGKDIDFLCDVDGDVSVTAADALCLLQYTVGKIITLPIYENGYPKGYEEKLMSCLEYETEPTAVTDAYEIASDGGMIYNPLSREAKKDGTISKYRHATNVTEGELKLDDGTTINYSMPLDITAYDMVPITYYLTPGKSNTVHFEATAAEDTERKNGKGYYDAILPNIVELNYEFLGYTTATDVKNARAKQSVDFQSDIQATQYPTYNTSDLIKSSTVTPSNYTWFRFKYTNVGDTILDSDGNGTFVIEPVLEKKNSKGQYEHYLIPENMFYRITDTLYPGESGTIDFIFNWDNMGKGSTARLSSGEYRIVLYNEIRNETSNPENYGTVIWGGYRYCTTTYEFKVAKEVTDYTINKCYNETKYTPNRNLWLHTYEEFMTSYDSYLSTSKVDINEIHTLYLQCAPWTETVTLKLMSGSKDNLKYVDIPVNVESDSLKINLNTQANNYIIKDDGTRYPAMMTQSMADMRVNSSLGPNADETLINELLDMKEAGVNVISTTSAFEFDTSRSVPNDNIDAFWFMADAIQLLGMKMEGFVTYPYDAASNVMKARLITNDKITYPTNYNPTSVTDTILAKANGVKTVYQFMRWGDNYFVDGDGNIPVTAEDTRGWMRIDISGRSKISSQDVADFTAYLQKKYISIDNLNYDWKQTYSSFYSINPSNGTSLDHDYISLVVGAPEFTEWSIGTNIWDVFRTKQRVNNYSTLLDTIGDSFKAVMSIRTEGGNYTSVVPYNTGNQRYRHVYYSQRRCAIIPQILASSGQIKYHSDYLTLPYTPSELTELTKSSVMMGITPTHLAQMDRLREIAVNEKYGQKYDKEYNLSGKEVKGVFISTTRSTYQWFKAIYEAGGIPGILWEDWLCDGFVTETQKKEMEFYSKKIAEAVATKEGQEWANSETVDASKVVSKSNGVFTYDVEYVKTLIDKYAQKRKTA